MVRVSRALFRDVGVSKTLADFLVCPLSKQPLTLSEDSGSLISKSIDVSYPIVNGIPCLVPKDGKLLDTPDASKSDKDTDPFAVNK